MCVAFSQPQLLIPDDKQVTSFLVQGGGPSSRNFISSLKKMEGESLFLRFAVSQVPLTRGGQDARLSRFGVACAEPLHIQQV